MDFDERRHSESRRVVDIQLDLLVKGQAELSKTVIEQHEKQTAEMKEMLLKHEKEHHKEYEPDHNEQHNRLGSWFKRLDEMWNNIFRSIGVFLLICVAYGVVVIIKAKTGGL